MTETTTWVTPEDVRELAFGITIGDDQLETLKGPILHAERKIRSRRDLQVEQRIAKGTLDVETVRGVVLDMVLRVVKNPWGVQSDGTGSVSTAYFRGAASGAVELLDEDVEVLRPRKSAFGTMGVQVPGWRIP